jgi:LIVCS family branched-chain amino acid:cation transporter
MGYSTLFQAGIIEGYQTTDMATGTIIGVIIITALQAKGIKKSTEQTKTILKAGVVAGICLIVIYLGLTILGLLVSTNKELIALFEANGRIDRTYLLNYIISASIGRGGTILMGIVVLLATFTTAIGSGSMLSQFFVRLSKGKWQYKYICIVAFAFGIFMTILSYIGGGSGVTFIITIAMPIMIILMPMACSLVFLNPFTNKIRNDNIYRAAVIMAAFVGACDYFGTGMFGPIVPGFSQLSGFFYGKWNIFASYGFSWIIPTAIACIIGAFIKYKGFEPRPFLRENAGQEGDEAAA